MTSPDTPQSTARDKDRVERILREVAIEMERAWTLHGRLHSAHEAHSVMREELEELWDEIRKKHNKRSSGAMRHEAIQLASTALCFIIDVLDQNNA